MTSYAMYVDQKLQSEGIDPVAQLKNIMKTVDAEMRKQFPDFFGVSPQV